MGQRAAFSAGRGYMHIAPPSITMQVCPEGQASGVPHLSALQTLNRAPSHLISPSVQTLGGFGHGFEGHYGIPFDWLEAYVIAGAQDGKLLNVGMYTRYADPADGESHVRYSLGAPVDASTYKTGFTFHSTGMQGLPSYDYSVQEVAFFIDVQRPSGKVVRLWQSRGGANYSWDDAFGAGTTTTSIPYGNIKWAVDAATIFDSKKACQ